MNGIDGALRDSGEGEFFYSFFVGNSASEGSDIKAVMF